MTPTLDTLRHAYEADPADAWRPWSDALEESGDVAAAARVRLLGRNGWRWYGGRRLGPPECRLAVFTAVAIASDGGWSTWNHLNKLNHERNNEDAEANRRRCEDWLLAHGH